MKVDKADWILTRLDDVAYWYQKDIPNSQQEAAGIQYYITADHIDSDALKIKRYSSLLDGQKGPTITKQFEEGDLLFSTRSTVLHKCALAPVAGVTGEKLLVIRIKPNSALIPEMLPFVMQSTHFWDFAINSASGSVNKFTSWTKIREYEFLMPPRDQQARLAELLWAADEVGETLLKSKEAIIAYRTRSNAEYFTNADSRKSRLKELLVKLQDGSHFSPKKLYDECGEGRYLYLTSKNIRSTGLDLTNVQYVDKEFHDSIFYRCDPRVGDILLTKDGANTGNVTINSYEGEMSVLSSVCLIRPNEEIIDKNYLFQFLKSEAGNQALLDEMTGTAIRRLTLTTLRTLMVPCPEMSVQKHIANRLTALDDVENQIASQINCNNLVKQALINQIFST